MTETLADGLLTPAEYTTIDVAVARAKGYPVHYISGRCAIPASGDVDGITGWGLYQPTRDPGLCAELAAEEELNTQWIDDSVAVWTSIAGRVCQRNELFADHPTRIRAWCVAVCRAVVGEDAEVSE